LFWWTDEEDSFLSKLVTELGDWSTITSHFPGCTNEQVFVYGRKVGDRLLHSFPGEFRNNHLILNQIGAKWAKNRWNSTLTRHRRDHQKQVRELATHS
jgi:hypothetical protein